MRNILVTVMMIVVMLVLFNTIVADNATGTRSRIQGQGNTANTQIGNLVP
ncbi:hypothetical protein [Paenibacillus herberti]|nr:hypothetical protein [Paenibacillus herberti]SDS25159.1 hypothetical protein SAMN05444162_1070 [Paenibacillaceae bacterium GAS479]